MSEAAARPVRARRRRLMGIIALALGVAVVTLLAALYAARRQIAREAVAGWLQSRGVASESEFQEIGPGRLVGRIRIGPPAAPDLTVERAEVDYSLAGLLSGRGVQVTSIRLVRPVLRASWRGSRFSAGALDRLIEEFRRRPPAPGAPSPTIEVDQARLQIATDYGLVRATADALVRDAKLARLDAATDPIEVTAGRLKADLGRATLQASAQDGRLTAKLVAPLRRAEFDQARLQDGELVVKVGGAYPDLRSATPSSGQATAALTAGGLSAVGAAGKALRLDAASDWRWTRGSSDALTGALRITGDVHEFAASDLRLATLAAGFQGPFALGSEPTLRLLGSAEARGGWSGLGAPVAGDSKEIAALKRGLRAFRASAQGVALTLDRSRVQAKLTGPARLLPDAGGAVRLAPRGAGYLLTAAGGGLPKLEADVRRVSAGGGGLTAAGTVKAALSIGPFRNGDFAVAGELRIAGGEARFFASRCAEIKAARLDLGANDAEQLAARICPSGAPLLSVDKAGWSLAGRAEGAAASVPFLQASLADGAGGLSMADRGGRLSAAIDIRAAQVRDTAKPERFRPLVMSGRVSHAGDRWTGGLDFGLKNGTALAHAALHQDDRSGAGGVAVTAPTVAFAPGGLQPSDLSPIAEPLGSQTQGSVSFTGAFDWTPAGATSSGELRIPAMAFKSPAGAVSGLSGAIRFTSLAPLIAPPGQVLHVARVGWALPVTDITASLALQEKALVVASAEGSAGGGHVFARDIVVPLEPNQPVRGAAWLEGVQLHDLVEASPFGDRVELEARVSGQIPFQIQDGKVHIAGGDLHAIAPGRLSIARSALTSVSAQGSIQAPAPAAAAAAGSTDTFTDFAYQALENLAFKTLDAKVDTRPNGRLGVLFHIAGYHDPPQHQEITLSWWDLIRRRFLGRKLPLPSGTGVDLTLDTSLNLDDLLKDYADFERLRSSGPVQR